MNMLGQSGQGSSTGGRGPGAQYFMNQLQTLMHTTGQRSNSGSQNSMDQFQNFMNSLRRMNQGFGPDQTRGSGSGFSNNSGNQGSLSNFFNTFNNSSQYQRNLNQFLRNDPNYQRQQNSQGLNIGGNTSLPQNNTTTGSTTRNNTQNTTQGTNSQNGSGFDGDMSLFGITADPVVETGSSR